MEKVKFKKYICMKKNLKDRFLSDKIFISNAENEVAYHGKNYKILSELWKDSKTGEYFSIQNVSGIVELYFIPEKSNIFVNKDFLDVTKNLIYTQANILSGSVIKTNTYIEGADGTGKTTAVNGLAASGILTIDRCVEFVTKIMNQNDRGLIVNSVEYFLKNNPNADLIFLYVSNKDEHYKRIFNREIVSDYDKTAFELQEKYLYTYNALKQYKNLHLVDTFNKSMQQVQDECKAIALNGNIETSENI